MLNRIKRFFDDHLAPDSDEMARDPEHALRLAVAVLLFEVAESDFQQKPEEQRMLIEAVKTQFQLPEQEAEALLEMAEREHAESTDYFEFTRLINQHYAEQQKIRLIEMLWRVAYSDQVLHHYEEHVIRRLAELLYVPHAAFIAAKHRVAGSV